MATSKEKKEFEELVQLTEETKNEEKNILQREIAKIKRYWMLCDLMKNDYKKYTEYAATLHLFYHVERIQLPNVEDIPISTTTNTTLLDCNLPNVTYNENIFDWILLTLTRKYYKDLAPYPIEIHTNSANNGIKALLNEMITLVRAGATPDQQKNTVLKTLRMLMTSYLPPFYRFLVTNRPWADFSTSVVAPYVFGYLVGPSSPNRRSQDGKRGGLLVHKCKFLQQSNCKGLCLHQCKLPAEELFFKDLGVQLYVKPNFITQECQWSWGIPSPSIQSDPNWPIGCISSCPNQGDLALHVKSDDHISSFCSPSST